MDTSVGPRASHMQEWIRIIALYSAHLAPEALVKTLLHPEP